MGVLRRRRRGGVGLRWVRLSLGVPGGRQESGETLRQPLPAGGPLRFEEKPLDIADPKLLDQCHRRLSDRHRRRRPHGPFRAQGRGNLLLKGGPDCTFTLANHEWNFDGDPGWTTAFAAEWEPGQKFPTLAIGHYVDRNAPGSPWGTCEDNSLYRPQPGDKPDYSVRTPLAPGFCALSMLFTDWNKSGVPSLRVSNDRQYYRGGEEQMWRIDPGKTPRLYTRADGWRHLSIYGMGIAEGDLDGSGYPEYFLTSMGDEKLQKLDPEEATAAKLPVYRDIAGEVGATAHIPYTGGDKRPSTAWHAEFADFNNAGPPRHLRLQGQSLADAGLRRLRSEQSADRPMERQIRRGRRCSGNRRQPQRPRRADRRLQPRRPARHPADQPRLERLALPQPRGQVDDGSPLPMGNWSEIKLVEPNPNRNAVGARISIKTGTRSQTRSVQVGGGDASGHAGWIHVGLGTAERAEIRVQWPDGD